MADGGTVPFINTGSVCSESPSNETMMIGSSGGRGGGGHSVITTTLLY